MISLRDLNRTVSLLLLAMLISAGNIAAQQDSVTARVLIDRAWDLRFSAPGQSLQYADSALHISVRIRHPLLTARAYRAKALVLVIDERILEGMPLYDSAIVYARIAGSLEYEASCFSLMAGMYGDHGDYDRAIELYAQGLDAANRSGDKTSIAILSNNLAESYVAGNRGDSLALRYYETSLRNCEEEKNWAFGAMVAANIAQLAASQHRHEQAAGMLGAARELMQRDTSDQYRYATTLHVLADVYLQLDSLDKAIDMGLRSLQIMDELQRPDNALRPLSVLARAYIQKRDLANAKLFSARLLNESILQNAKLFIRDGYKCLSDIAKTENNPQDALKYYELYKAWNDSVFRMEREQSISDMEIRAQLARKEMELKYESDKKDAENNNLKERNESLKRERLLAIFSCVVFLALGILLYFLYRKKQKINAELQEEKKTVEKQAHEKSILVHEIHHRVKNNLTLLKSLLFLQSKTSAHEEVKRILEECQARIQSMALVHSNLYGENENGMLEVRAFAELLLSELSASFKAQEHDIAFEIEGTCRDVNIAQSVPLGLVLNELATNSIKYAFTDVQEPLISVQISETAGSIHIVYSDNGPGLPNGFDADKGGFGFRLLHILSQQLNATLRYERGEQGPVFRITIPV